MNMKILKTLILFGAVSSFCALAQTRQERNADFSRRFENLPAATAGDLPLPVVDGTRNGSGSYQGDGLVSAEESNPRCTPQQYSDDIIEIAETFEISSCYDDRVPPPPSLNDPLDPTGLTADYNICKCLREDKKHIKALQDIMNGVPRTKPTTEEVMLSNFKANAGLVTERIKRQRNHMAFQASVLFDGKDNLTAAYKNEIADKIIGMKGPGKGLHNMAHAINYQNLGVSNIDSFKEGVTNTLKGLDVPAKPDANLFVAEVLAPGQCVGAREYFAFKALPSESSIFSDLQGKFEDADWNANKLKSAITSIEIMPKPVPKEEMKKLREMRAKLRFLNKNPMIKNLMAFEPSATTENIPEPRKSEIRRLTVDGKLKDMKEKLFGFMKDMAKGKRSCYKDDSCLSKSLKDGSYTKFKARMQDFFSSPEVAQLVLVQSEHEINNEVAKIVDPANFQTQEVPLTHKDVMTEFVASTGLNPDACNERSSNSAEDCANIYSAYCKRLDNVIPKLNWGARAGTRSSMDVEEMNDLNPSFEKNINLQKFNDLMCNQKRSKEKGQPGVTFFEFKQKYCAGSSKPECNSNKVGDIGLIRKKYLAEYDNENVFNTAMQSDPVEIMTDSGYSKMAENNGSGSSNTPDWSSLRQQLGLEPGAAGSTVLGNTATEKGPAFSGLAKGLASLSNAMGADTSASVDETVPNYSNTIMGGSSSSNNQLSETPKVENMDKTEREELLEDWKKEMAEWKANKNNADPAQAAVASVRETEALAKIQALEQLLAQQKKLTEDQYKLINDSIAAQANNAQRSIASVEEDEEPTSRSTRKKSNSGIVGSNVDIDEESQRAPGNATEQLNTAGSNSGSSSGAAAASRSRTSGANAFSDSSRDSVAREEAKLVNLRENSNGSITVTASGSGSANANAIVVPVNDQIYLQAQSNPNGFSLAQIQQSIPQDQIAKLQDKGDYFILLLQNGTKPPLEVKVRKGADNKLVQVDGAPIVTRRVSLDSLRNTLPVRAPASTR